MLKLTTGQATSAGRKARNEDSMGLLVPSDPQLLEMKGASAVLCDGVSAADGGAVAAETSVQNFLNDYFSTPETWTVETSAQKVLSALNRWLYSRGAEFANAERGYVCTLSALVLKSRTAYLFHVGDSRVYLLRKGGLTQLTTDHALRIGDTTTYLSRAMGLDSRVAVDFKRLPVEVGDVFLLTSDGVHDYLSTDALERLTAPAVGASDLDATCESLIEAALAENSPDNLTAQLLRVDAVPDATADEYVKRLTALPFPPELRPGLVLDGFRIEEELHASSRSQVYRVTRLSDGRTLALKTPSVNFEDDAGYIERFALEHWVGTRVSSPNLVQTLAPPKDRSCLYSLMEFVEGQTLEQWIERRRRLPVREMGEVASIADQIGRALIALHRKGIIHQDLKPSNIVLSPSGSAKVIDYGSVFVGGVDEIASPIVREKLLGTASYAAPEYVLGRVPTRAADTYSLGSVVYEMLTGQLPYGEAGAAARSPAHFQELRYRSAAELNPYVPPWVDAAVRRAVALTPEARYDEVTEFLYDLRHPNLELTQPTTAPKSDEARTRWRGLALLLLVTQFVTLFWLSQVHNKQHSIGSNDKLSHEPSAAEPPGTN